MDIRLAILLCAFVIGAVLAYARRRSLTPSWAWDESAVQLVVGGRLTEIHLAEVRSIAVSHGHLVFETARGSIPVARRWVVPPFVGALASACGLPEADVQRALEASSPASLWRGEAGAFGLPGMSPRAG